MKQKGAEGEPFLVRFDGTPIDTSPEMTRLLNKIFGKKIGCSMLRSIYLTEKYGDVVKEMKEDVGAMGTSTETAQNNYIKSDWNPDFYRHTIYLGYVICFSNRCPIGIGYYIDNSEC